MKEKNKQINTPLMLIGSALFGNAKMTFLVLILIVIPFFLVSVTVFCSPTTIFACDEKQMKKQIYYNQIVIQKRIDETIANVDQAIIKDALLYYSANLEGGSLISLGDGYLYCSDNDCIKIQFYPSATQLAHQATAYCSAVDGAIEQTMLFNSDYDSDALLDMSNMTVEDEDGNIIANRNNDYIVQLTESSSENQTGAFSSSFKLYIESNPQKWEHDLRKAEGEVVAEDVAVYFQEQYLNGITGVISIPIYYDCSAYRRNELAKIRDKLGEDSDQLELLIAMKYKNYQALLDEEQNEQLYTPLIQNGYLFQIPMQGLSASCLNSEEIRNEELGDVIGSDGDIWTTIGRKRRDGTLSTNACRYNCTEFANYWFYCLYGQGHCLYGDGKDMVNSLMASDYGRQHFYLSYLPQAGAIFSIGSYTSENGHVGCVDGVDFEKRTITISHANYGTAGAIILKKTLSFSQFKAMVDGYGEGAWVRFACPKYQTFAEDSCLYSNLISHSDVP